MALYRDEAVVLRTAKLGEADRIITFFTRDHGKVRAVAKGVRRTKSRFGGRLEPFMRVDVLLSEGRSLDNVNQAESVQAYAGSLSAHYDEYCAANVICETLNDITTTEHEPAREQYQLLIGALHALAEQKHNAQAISASYVLRALALAGWTPRLASCVVCGRKDELTYFSPAAGGMMCNVDHTPEAKSIDQVSAKQMQALLAGNWNVLDNQEITNSTRQFVESWAQYYLERPIRSLRLLH